MPPTFQGFVAGGEQIVVVVDRYRRRDVVTDRVHVTEFCAEFHVGAEVVTEESR
jgi:hypothetical protein